MSDDRPDEGREYHWPNGEVEVVFHVTNDNVVLTCVEYPSLAHFWATVDRDSIKEGDIIDAVRDLPSPEQLSDVDFDQFVE